MTPEELGRIRDIYEAARPLGGADREALLERECRGVAEMRREVDRLLQACEHVPAWLDLPLAAAARQWAAPEPVRMEGRRLGNYTLIREIGRGGMGCVYLAERSDGAFRKQAAIKLVLPSGNTAGVIARFQQEREILASLDHPNIAKLLDGGTTEEGWPYFVMEFVDGQRIDRWCDERKLNISRRIELFRSVTGAVRYAHQRLVVHRDLKPGNILVTNDGVVKLLDFGIARVLSPHGAGDPPETLTLARIMTPEYASPEQATGDAITTLTDVYSLGVILYELLTGHRPYRLMSAAVHEMARVIAEVEPARPSEVVTTTEPASGPGGAPITPETISALREADPARLRRRIEGDLDSIVLTALRKEPERRYGSVEAFGDDLQRHLEQRPVAAREATLAYRFRRFCVRNPGAVAAVALLAILFLAGMGAVVWQTRQNLASAPLNPVGAAGMAPALVFFSGCGLAALVAAAFYSRPSRLKLAGAAAGGVVWATIILGKYWLGAALGWWRSRIVETQDPLLFFSPWIWLMYSLVATAGLLLLSMIGRRFGWKGQALCVVVMGFGQELRERIWFSGILPTLTFEPGLTPILGGGAIVVAGWTLGLLVMRLIAGQHEGARERRNAA